MKNKGFTLVELLIYTVIVASVGAMIVQTLVSVTTAQQKIEAREIVDENLDFALKKIGQSIKAASSIVGTPSNTLTLTINGETVEYSLSLGILQKEVEGVDIPITSDKVIVSANNGNLFTKIDNSLTIHTIQIKIKVEYDSDDLKLSNIKSEVQTTVGLR